MISCKFFKSNSYSQSFLNNLYQLWIRQELTDLKFIISNKIFHVHRLVMQTCSPYFNALLSFNLKEISTNGIELHEVSENIFELLLNYVYTGTINVDDTLLCDIIVASDYFGFIEITEFYCKYLCEKLNELNAIDIYKFLSSYFKFYYAEKAKLYLCKNYTNLISTQKFLNIDFVLLIELLKNHNLIVNSEFEIFESVVQWLAYDYENRFGYLKDLLSLIRISSLKSIKITNYLNDIECDDLKIKIGSYLYEAFEIQNYSSIAKFEEPRNYSRKSILIIGGIRDAANNRLNRKVFCFDTVNLKIFSICDSFLARSNHCISELNDLVYISGGEINLEISDLVEIFDLDYFRQLINDYYSNSIIIINASDDNESVDDYIEYQEENKIKNQNLIQARTDFGMCTVDDKLYVFGGWIGSTVGDLVECYNPLDNKWFNISTLPSLRYEFACVALKNSSFIYLIGGTSTFDTKLSLVERFDVSSNSWQSCQSMNEKRSGCSCAIVNEKIIAVGGFNGRSVLSSCEIYDPLNDRWFSIHSMNYKRYGCIISTIDDTIYAIGGISCLNSKEMVNCIEYYNLNNDKWYVLDEKIGINIFKAAFTNV